MSADKVRPVRLGLIGLGHIATLRHLPALRRSAGLRVVALCDIAPQRLAQAHALYPGATPYDDYRALLAHAGLEAVGILTPSPTHAEIALAALDAGLHILVEKPLATSLDDGEALLARAQSSGRVASLGFHRRWHRLVRRARALIRAGAVGQVQAIRSVASHHVSLKNLPDWVRWRASSGGQLLNSGPHQFDLWRYLLDREVQQVYADSRSESTYEDHVVSVSANLEGGVLASSVMLADTSPSNEIEVYGDQGRLRVSLYHADGLQVYAKATYPGEPRDRLRKLTNLLREAPQMIGALRHGGDFVASFGSMWEDFALAVRGVQPVGVTLLDGLRALQVCLAAAESARRGQPVLLSDAPRDTASS